MPFFDKYPYTNFHNVNLDWVLERVKEWGQMVEDNNTRFENLQEANEAFKTYVTEYLENLDVQAEIDDKLDRMLASGVLTEYLRPYISNDVTSWLEENITEPAGVVIDSSLTVAGACADAKAVGDRFNRLNDDLNNLKTISPELQDIFLRCFEKLLWKDNTGTTLYTELSIALTGRIVYTLGVNMSIMPGSYTIDYNNGNILFLSLSENSVLKRRIFYVDSGVKSLNDGEGNPTNVYPISVPRNVTYAKVEITPSERQLAIYPVFYDSNNRQYVEYVPSDGYHTGKGYSAIPPTNKNIYLAVFSRYNASNAAYESEPTDVRITFGTQYSLGENMIVANVAGSPIDGKIKLNTNLATKRRTFFSTTGLQTSYDANDNKVSQRYPIPLPLNVKTVTAKIEPSSMYIALYILSYNESTKEYTEYVPTVGYKEGETKYEISGVHGELYALPIAKYDQANSAFANEPTNLVIDVTTY